MQMLLLSCERRASYFEFCEFLESMKQSGDLIQQLNPNGLLHLETGLRELISTKSGIQPIFFAKLQKEHLQLASAAFPTHLFCGHIHFIRGESCPRDLNSQFLIETACSQNFNVPPAHDIQAFSE
jgi:hypothetical protein